MIMRLLICIGLVVCPAFLDAKQYQYQTADLFEAVKIGHKRDVKQYLKSGVDVNALDQLGKTVLDYAAEMNREKIVRMLVKKSAKVTTEQNFKAVTLSIKQYARKHFWLSLGLFALASLIFIPALIGMLTNVGYALLGYILLAILTIPITASCYFTSWGLGCSGLYWQQKVKNLQMLNNDSNTTILL